MFATVSDMFRGRLTFLGPDREFSRKQDNAPGAFDDDALEPHSFWGGLGKWRSGCRTFS